MKTCLIIWRQELSFPLSSSAPRNEVPPSIHLPRGPRSYLQATTEVASVGLSDLLARALLQPKSTEIVPNPLDPNFIYDTSSGSIQVGVSEGTADTTAGLDDGDGNRFD
jgi:hypothetical protein